jgi:hypothetical protein
MQTVLLKPISHEDDAKATVTTPALSTVTSTTTAKGLARVHRAVGGEFQLEY